MRAKDFLDILEERIKNPPPVPSPEEMLDRQTERALSHPKPFWAIYYYTPEGWGSIGMCFEKEKAFALFEKHHPEIHYMAVGADR